MPSNQKKTKAPLNRTLTLSKSDLANYSESLLVPDSPLSKQQIINKVINKDLLSVIDYLPEKFVDLLFIDPPYNLQKNYSGLNFKKMSSSDYEQWFENWLGKLIKVLKDDASIYVCSDWKTSLSITKILEKYFTIQNRITWEREKGRGAKSNWKNCSEDIWFCTLSQKYKFNVEAVKLKRKVLAPYKNNGKPKDWTNEGNDNFRITSPSNLWTDITIPFWSMPENTDHPTQKPEKLLAKIILASSNEGDVVLDPFMGSGTTAVVAKKLNRKYCGIEINQTYCALAQKRLEKAAQEKSIQGYVDGVFWERNSLKEQKLKVPK